MKTYRIKKPEATDNNTVNKNLTVNNTVNNTVNKNLISV